MQKLHQEIFINAPREKVWDIMLGEETYKEWTKAFSPTPNTTSHFEGNWEEGSKMLFICENQDGGTEGMVSRIKENRKPEFLSIEHIGIYKDGVEDTESETAKQWAPAYENYTFIEKDGGTELHIDMDVDGQYQEMFEKMWSAALESLKGLFER